MTIRRLPKEPSGPGRAETGETAGSPGAADAPARLGWTELPPDLYARIETSAREIAERIGRERATAERLWAELMAAPLSAWPGLAASGRFALPAFLETLCENSWSLAPERSEALAQFGRAASQTLEARSFGTATVSGLQALVRASLGDAWRRQGRWHDAELAFLGAFGELVESEDAIDFGLVQALWSRLLRDRGELSEAYVEALRAAKNLHREGTAPLAAGAWGGVAVLAAEIGAWGRADSALKAARREPGAKAQRAAARVVARGVLRLRLLRHDAAAEALTRAAEESLDLDSETRADFAAVAGLAADLACPAFFHAPRIRARGWTSRSNSSQEVIAMTDPKPVVLLPDTEDSEPNGVAMLRDPSEWEAVEGFRHTFLIHFTPQGLAASLRQAGQNLYDGALENAGGWPRSRMPPLLEQALAGAADCRFLEGYFGMLGREAEQTSLMRPEIQISNFALEYAAAAGALATRIEQDLAAVGATFPPTALK